MKTVLPDRYYSFNELASKLHVTEYEIVNDLLEGNIKYFTYQKLNQVTPIGEMDHIILLLPILNEYASKCIDELLQNNRFKMKREKEQWIGYRDSGRAFEAWLGYYGDNINSVRIVIPHDEAIRYEKTFMKKDNSQSNRNYLVIDAVQKMAKDLYEKNGKWPQYSKVLKSLQNEATKDGATGALIISAGNKGICLSNGEIISTKTLQNWLTDYKKTFPELKKVKTTMNPEDN